MINVCLMHPFDPRGSKVGGLETYTRDFIRLHPDDLHILMIGVDGFGDLKLGKVTEITLQGRKILFLPVVRFPEGDIHQAARTILNSITFRFFVGLLRFAFPIRRLLRKGRYTVDLRRVELARFCAWAGVPFIQMLHGEGAPNRPMDSLLSRYRFTHEANEAFAVACCARFLCVNRFITDRIREKYPQFADKVSTLTTWYDPAVFKPTPFPESARPFKVVYCGRLDLFKVPSLMFRTIARLHQALDEGALEFHYIGTSDCDRFPEFELIQGITVRHGFKPPAEIAKLLASAHAGILTSDFEGMPRCVLESLGAGRPVCAVHLPQLEPVVVDGVSGFLTPRGAERAMIASLVSNFTRLRDLIEARCLDPVQIARQVSAYTPTELLGLVYGYHRELAARRPAVAPVRGPR